MPDRAKDRAIPPGYDPAAASANGVQQLTASSYRAYPIKNAKHAVKCSRLGEMAYFKLAETKMMCFDDITNSIDSLEPLARQ